MALKGTQASQASWEIISHITNQFVFSLGFSAIIGKEEHPCMLLGLKLQYHIIKAKEADVELRQKPSCPQPLLISAERRAWHGGVPSSKY